MIQVSVLYPNRDGAEFDMDYYTEIHMPLVQRLTDCRRVTVQRGVAGARGLGRPPFVAIGQLYYDSITAFQAAFATHAQRILGDVANFTNVEPTIQINEELALD